jgi:ATP-dependent Clp protease ATP-binding subunit ClpA
MFERFTRQAREVPIVAQREARALAHSYIGTEHLLLALLDDACGAPATILGRAGLTPERVRADVNRFLERSVEHFGDADAHALESIGIDLDAVMAKLEETFGPDALQPTYYEVRRGLFGRRRRVARTPMPGHIPFTPRAKKVLELSLREALRLKYKYIGSEHILLGLIREGEGLAMKILVDAGIDVDEVSRQAVASLHATRP